MTSEEAAAGAEPFEFSIGWECDFFTILCGGDGGGIGALCGENAEGIGGEGNVKGFTGGDGVVEIGDDSLHAELGILFGDHSAGHAIGVAGIAFDPDFHAAFFAFIDGVFDEVEVFGGEVGGAEGARVVDHVDAPAAGVDVFDVVENAFFGDLPAPDSPVDGGVFARGVREGFGGFIDGGHGDFLPRLSGYGDDWGESKKRDGSPMFHGHFSFPSGIEMPCQ